MNGTVGAAIIVDPFDARTVWLGTGGENDEIWRSNDCGATWKQVNTGMGSVGDGMTFGGVGDGAQWSMQIDPVEPNTLYATSGYGAQSLWKTSDGGTTWTDVLAGTEYEKVADYRFVNNVSLDPTDHLHLVVSTHGACKAPYDPSCIGETKDGGKTWSVVKAPEGWVEGGGLVLVKGGLWVWCGTTLMVTKDSGKTWEPNALSGGGSCEAEYTIRAFEPAANGNYYLGSRAGMLRSKDGEKWEHITGTNGFMVMVTQGSKHVFAANQWQPVIWSASLDDDATWTELEAPEQISQGSDGGVPFTTNAGCTNFAAACRSWPTTTRTAFSTRPCSRAAWRAGSCRRLRQSDPELHGRAHVHAHDRVHVDGDVAGGVDRDCKVRQRQLGGANQDSAVAVEHALVTGAEQLISGLLHHRTTLVVALHAHRLQTLGVAAEQDATSHDRQRPQRDTAHVAGRNRPIRQRCRARLAGRSAAKSWRAGATGSAHVGERIAARIGAAVRLKRIVGLALPTRGRPCSRAGNRRWGCARTGSRTWRAALAASAFRASGTRPSARNQRPRGDDLQENTPLGLHSAW